MKIKSLVVVAALAAFMGIAHAEEGKAKKPKREISPELLEKYDKDKDGKFSKEEKAELRKDKAAKPKGEKKPKREISPELLEKYDKDKDGKLSKEEKAELRKDKAANPKGEKKPKGERKKKKDAGN